MGRMRTLVNGMGLIGLVGMGDEKVKVSQPPAKASWRILLKITNVKRCLASKIL
jgi:hypothetical protein